MKQEEQRVENVAIKRAEAQLARAQGIHAAAVLKLKRANLVQGFRELAKEHRLLRLKQKAEEQAKLVERAHASRELRDKPIEAVKQARKYSIVVQMRGLEKAAVSARHLRSRVGQRDDWGEAQAPASTLTAMPFGEVKARLELQKAREVEKLRRKRMAIAEESTQRKQEVLAKAEELARYRHEAAATAERRRMEKLILGKKRQQKAERQRLANELRTQQIKNEFLHSTKLNVEKQVREQQMRGAERRAARQAADDIKKESLTEGIRRREQYQRMANKAAAEVLEASGNAERAQLLCGLEQQKNELEVMALVLHLGPSAFALVLYYGFPQCWVSTACRFPREDRAR
ncbi:hypothetical protein CSUI_007100 [Cystoisospora suis]|uniref:Uncharacterized protein n=1 Tax=Cystoisospora suis TaxID=483139 RepID=A0A2C6KPM7_9APIC|nr:hypothetical protein CSUI_007100 [Cystoisospora suis]